MYYTSFRAQIKAKKILEEAEEKTEYLYMESKEPIKIAEQKREETKPKE